MNAKDEPSSRGDLVAKHASMHDIAKAIQITHSRTNSICKLFDRQIVITLDDLKYLFDDVHSKLAQHGISEYTFNAAVHYRNKEIADFGSWKDFYSMFDRRSDKRTESVILRWVIPTTSISGDNLPPVQHMTIRLSSPVNPLHFMQAMFSGDAQEIEQFEIDNHPMMCRVDFAHNIFSEELMQRVARWNEGRNTAEPTTWWYKPLYKHSKKLLAVVKYLPPVLAVTASIIYFIKYNSRLTSTGAVTIGYVYVVGLWFMISNLVIYTAIVGARSIEDVIGTQLQQSRKFSVFALTDGDTKFQNELAGKNMRSVSGAMFKFCVSVVVGLLQPLISFVLEKLING